MRKGQKKEDAGARNGRDVSIILFVLFHLIVDLLINKLSPEIQYIHSHQLVYDIQIPNR